MTNPKPDLSNITPKKMARWLVNGGIQIVNFSIVRCLYFTKV